MLVVASAHPQSMTTNDPRLNVVRFDAGLTQHTIAGSVNNATVASDPAVTRGSRIESLGQDSPDVVITSLPGTQSTNSVFVNPRDPSRVLNSNNGTSTPPATNFAGAGG